MDHKNLQENGKGCSWIQISSPRQTLLEPRNYDKITLCKTLYISEVRDYWRNKADGTRNRLESGRSAWVAIRQTHTDSDTEAKNICAEWNTVSSKQILHDFAYRTSLASAFIYSDYKCAAAKLIRLQTKMMFPFINSSVLIKLFLHRLSYCLYS
jgi:hypothetical protein